MNTTPAMAMNPPFWRNVMLIALDCERIKSPERGEDPRKAFPPQSPLPQS
jgi:hypothetical protein